MSSDVILVDTDALLNLVTDDPDWSDRSLAAGRHRTYFPKIALIAPPA